MKKYKRFSFVEGGFTYLATFKKPVSERTAKKLTSLIFWIVSEGGKVSRHLNTFQVSRSK